MEKYENGVYKIQRKDFVKIGRWEYCFIEGNDVVDGFGLAGQDYYTRLIKEMPDPLPFYIINTDYVHGMAGSEKGRVWVSIRGNIQCQLLFPNTICKTPMQYNFFGILSTFAVKDVLNKYAPNTFTCKFPNDVICKEHERKISGICDVPFPHYLASGFAMNVPGAPPDELLRKEGLKACCLANHMKDIPKPEQIITEVGERMIELNEELGNDPDKFLAKFNDSYSPYVKKKFVLEMNNRNADVEKDGTLWSAQWPNALFKGYLNGKAFDSSEWNKKGQFWDEERFVPKANDDEYKEFLKKVKAYEDKVNKK